MQPEEHAVVTGATYEVAKMLCTKGRVVSAGQLAEHFFGDARHPMRSALELCRKLDRDGLAKKSSVIATRIVIDDEPLLRASQGEHLPQEIWEQIGWKNQRRWRKSGASIIILEPTKATHGLFGGTYRLSRPLEREHDLALTECYLRIRDSDPELSETWVREDSIDTNRFNGRRPDAIYGDGQEIAVDVLGRSYSATRIQSIVQHFQLHSEAIELR